MHRTTRKSELRGILRERRRAIPAGLRASAAIAATDHLAQSSLPLAGTRIAIYLPADGEMDTRALAEHCRSLDSELYLPVVGSDGVMHFALWERGAALQVNRYGIPEPGAEYPLHSAAALDIVFMPLVGWDRWGRRLGMGGGFYDRALAGMDRPVRVGLGFACQEVGRLPADNWDIPMDYVATESALHECLRAEATNINR